MTHYYGWKRQLPDQRDIKYEPKVTELPQEVDLRPGCPPVYDQGQLGSCTANAISAHLDYNRKKQGEAFIDPSRLFVYYNERASEGTTHSDSGATIRESVQEVIKHGACPETEWPYNIQKFATKPLKKCYVDALRFEALQYASVAPVVSDIKSCLAEGFPLVIGFSVYESFESKEVAKTGIMPMPSPSEQLLGGHAVMVVGYVQKNGEPYWVVRNSWSENWGDMGYFYMPEAYLTNQNLASDFWTLRKVK